MRASSMSRSEVNNISLTTITFSTVAVKEIITMAGKICRVTSLITGQRKKKDLTLSDKFCAYCNYLNFFS